VKNKHFRGRYDHHPEGGTTHGHRHITRPAAENKQA